METVEINYLLAIGYALIGWVVRVAMYYFQFDKDTTSFDVRDWWRIYDKYIILGFVGCFALSFLSDWVWHFIDAWFGMEGVVFDERVNILIGFAAIGVLYFFDKNAQKKSHG